ncbi:MAG: CPBP family intramembrane glutamic endopeptidase [Candidatus Sumerlaeia bacterium]|nr:CPBP family intramembrane glutamic endopeptidase [Candidatus Sumerlaeia bacterium]
MHLPDHLLFLLAAGAFPVYSVWRMNAAPAATADAEPVSRTGTYLATIGAMAAALAALLGWWAWAGRPFASLGLGAGDGPAWALASASTATTALALLAVPAAAARSARVRSWLDRELADSLRGGLELILPRTPREFVLFAALSAMAAVAEEIVFRGFLLWYLGAVLPWWAAAPLAAALFGACHGYQGPAGIAKTAAMGLALCLLYLGAGALWPAMAFHFFLNIFTARLAYRHVFGGR